MNHSLSSSSTGSRAEDSRPKSPSSQKRVSNSEILRAVNDIGYANATKLSTSLQGSVWKLVDNMDNTSVLKISSKYLYSRSVAISNGIEVKIHEDIVKEGEILKYLSSKEKCPKSIVKYSDFFETETSYYLLMENGGKSLFNFVTQARELINIGKLDRTEWNRVVLIIFKQMIECIEYIHSQRICHFDISLENFLINDVNVIVDGDKVTFVKEDIQVKLCDFGLAEKFEETVDFKCDKFCGKKQYQSPEVRQHEAFDAKKNDIWAMGMCLFMMVFQCPPWTAADLTNPHYIFVKRHSLTRLLEHWKLINYADMHMIRLLCKIFQCEDDRISLKVISQYFNEYHT